MMKKGNIFLILFLIIIFVILSFWYLKIRKIPLDVTLSTERGGVQDVKSDFLLMISEIQGLKIDLNIFESKIFESLEDFTPLIEAPSSVGRTNPFSPFSAK